MVSRFDDDDLAASLADFSAASLALQQINAMCDSSTSAIANDTPLDLANNLCNTGEDDQIRFEEIQELTN